MASDPACFFTAFTSWFLRVCLGGSYDGSVPPRAASVLSHYRLITATSLWPADSREIHKDSDPPYLSLSVKAWNRDHEQCFGLAWSPASVAAVQHHQAHHHSLRAPLPPSFPSAKRTTQQTVPSDAGNRIERPWFSRALIGMCV